MTFYDTGNAYNSLVHYVNDLVGLPSGDTTQYSLAAKARATNTAKHKLVMILFQASDAWEIDDNSFTDLPIATTDLVVGQRDYSLPTSAVTIERVEVLDSAGNYYRIHPMDETERPTALTDYGESTGTPTCYWVKGRSIFLDAAPASGSVTTTAGLKVYFSREANEVTAATTTTEIGFDDPGDRAIAHMVALEFAARKGLEIKSYLQSELYGPDGLITLIKARMAKRLRDRAPRIRIHMENME